MTLMLHCGAEEVDYDALREVTTPPATPTHVPMPHHRLVDLVVHSLSYYGHEVVEQHHALTKDGARYFGLFNLRSSYGGYQDSVALRNSHDKSFPVGIGFGSHVFVCDNLALVADHVIRRKHTANAKRDLPGLVQEVVEPLAGFRHAQQKTFERYKGTALTDQTADHAIMTMYREGVINVQRIAEVAKEWDSPSFAYEQYVDRSAWQLFNAATFVLTGRVAENPSATRRLHQIIDGVCEHV